VAEFEFAAPQEGWSMADRMTSRRTFLAVVAGGVLSTPRHSDAQGSGKVVRIGFLASIGAQSGQPLLRSFRDGLREHGWIESQNVHIDYSYDSPGGPSVDERAHQLAKLDFHVIVADSTPSALALKRANVSLPVVFTAMSEPVETGVVESLARPGRNFTGFTTVNRELMPKRIEVIKELVPRVRRLVYLGDPDYPSHRHSASEVTEVARRLGLLVEAFELRGPVDFDAIGARREQLRDGAFVVEQSLFFVRHTGKMIGLELGTKIPAMYAHRQFVERGGTVCYGVNIAELYRRAGGYVDRILKGARPAELPVEQPTKFDFVINLKTAKALGLRVPSSLLARADQIIE
jgi:putative ABC transport system substrate-binding protein